MLVREHVPVLLEKIFTISIDSAILSQLVGREHHIKMGCLLGFMLISKQAKLQLLYIAEDMGSTLGFLTCI